MRQDDAIRKLDEQIRQEMANPSEAPTGDGPDYDQVIRTAIIANKPKVIVEQIVRVKLENPVATGFSIAWGFFLMSLVVAPLVFVVMFILAAIGLTL